MSLSFKIKNLLFICLIYFGFFSAQNFDAEKFKTGADQPEIYLPMLQGKRIGVVTNQTGFLSDSTHLVDFLVKNNISIKRIFAPEHGFRGNKDAGEYVRNSTDVKTGLPIVSLYGKNKKPSPELVKDLDLILFDIQDVGVRFYTYISTLSLVMESAAENNVSVLVLDRPNPHDGYTDGPILNPKWESFIGMHPVPMIYGLTIGEYGAMVNGEKWLSNGIQAHYSVVKMKNYHKKQRYPMMVAPSPNLPNDKSINLYPSLCLFERTNVSVGRGTDFPFQIYGSPWMKKINFEFVPKPNKGDKNPLFKDKICYGEDLRTYNEDLRRINLSWLINAYQDYSRFRGDFFVKNIGFDTLVGSDVLRKQIIQGKSEKEIRESWQKDLKDFEKIRQKYIMYED